MFAAQHLIPADLPDLSDTLSVSLAAWQARWPDMGVLALVPEALADRVPALQAACRERGVALLGAVFPSLFTGQGFVTDQVLLLCLAPMPPWLFQPVLDAAGREAWHEAVRFMQATQPVAPGAEPLLFMVFDGMLPDVGSLVDELHMALEKPVRYSGVNAGSETFQPMACLFDAERQAGMGVISLLLPPTVDSLTRHGYPVSRALMTATTGQGNRIDTIDHRPAFDVYQQLILEEYGVQLTRENFYDYAVHFPFGLVTMVDVLVRIPVALGDDGSLICVGEIPPNSLMRLLRAPAADQGLAVTELATFIAERQADSPARSWLHFYCAGRRMHLGEQALQELQSLQRQSGQGALLGALTLGEIDTLDAAGLPRLPRFHNACLVALG
ncbi:FIST signal transduction protein [Curvibacter lanceolatus]|uniref:FIST signal transduction protein n=1 Tax=Curvibacter lanceolatus TaxID=86182 RepID=UPI002357ADF1|nr:FIST C-terminal domain-containing protein [Curvibacter lanceolatus]